MGNGMVRVGIELSTGLASDGWMDARWNFPTHLL